MTEFDRYRYVDNIEVKVRVLRFLWGIVWLFCFRITPRGFIFNYCRVGLLRLFGAKIGRGCRFSPSVSVWAPWNLTVGDFSAFGDGVEIYSMANIRVGSKVAVSQRSYLCTGSHNISSLMRPLVTRPIIIKDHAWVCAEAFVGPGVTVGVGSVVAARACVVKDVSDWTVVGGNPAKELKRRIILD